MDKGSWERSRGAFDRVAGYFVHNLFFRPREGYGEQLVRLARKETLLESLGTVNSIVGSFCEE